MLLIISFNSAIKRLLLLSVVMAACLSFKTTAQQLDTSVTAPTVDRLMKLRRDNMRGEHVDDAFEIFRDEIREDENNAEALYRYGISRFQRRDFNGGMEYVKRAVELDPENTLYRYSWAKGLSEVGKIEDAIQQYESLRDKVVRGSPLAVKADMELGLLYLGKAAAVKDIRAVSLIGTELMRRYPNELKAVRTVASIYATVELLAAAKEVYLHLVRLTPDNPLSEYYLATAYEAMLNIPKAEQHYNLAIEKGPDTPIANQARIKLGLISGFASLKSGDKEAARKAFQSVVDIDPRNVVANLNAGVLNHELGHLDLARDDYMRIVIMNPSNYDVRLRLAVVFLDSGKWVDAVRELDIVKSQAPGTRYAKEASKFLARVDTITDGSLELLRQDIKEEGEYALMLGDDPENGQAYLGMGELYLQQGKISEAKAVFLKAIELDETLGDAYRNLGLISGQDGELDEAVRYFQLALALSADDTNIENTQMLLLIALGQQDFVNRRYEESITRFMEVVNKFEPQNQRAFWGLAMANEQLQEFDQAVEWYLKLVEYYPEDLEARLNAAFIYEQMEEEDRAIQQYRAILKSKNVEDSMIEVANQRLDQIKRRTNGFTTTVGYFMTLDDNLSSSRTDKIFEYRSDTFASVNYNYKLKKGLTLSVNFSPTYSVYHTGQLDYFNLSITPDLVFNLNDYYWTVGLNRTTQSSVILDEQSSTINHAINANVDWTINKANLNTYFSYSGFATQQNPFNDSRSILLDFNVSHPLTKELPIRYGYTINSNRNKQPQGNDYAFISQAIHGRIDKRISQKFSASLDGRLSQYFYTNIDSVSNTRKRRSVTALFGGSVNYRLTNKCYFSAGFHRTVQQSNLPATGVILDEALAIEFQQSAYLGGYSKNTFNVGLRLDI